MKLTAIDLNLLFALDALITEVSVSRAARRVHVTQPAMSHSLRRLRDALRDPLLVRFGKRVELTSRARQIGPPLREHLAALDRLLFAAERFRPQVATGTVRLGVSQYWQPLISDLVALLRRDAPSVDLVARPIEAAAAARVLAGELDLAITATTEAAEPLERARLVEDRYVCVVRAGHPWTKERPTGSAALRATYVVVTPRGAWFTRMARLGRERSQAVHVAVETPSVRVAFDVVRATDFVCVLPAAVSRSARSARSLRTIEPPLALGGLELSLVWHPRTAADPLHAWVRGVFSRMAKQSYGKPRMLA